VLAGLWFARRVSRLLVRRLATLPGVKANAIAAIEKLVYYALVLGIAAVALPTVNILISAFAVLGGAFAIGLGFGAQNLFNNFMSGLILIIEQPIRIDDLIEVESQRGIVVDVGARCTRMRRDDGVDLMVPNSRLLEKYRDQLDARRSTHPDVDQGRLRVRLADATYRADPGASRAGPSAGNGRGRHRRPLQRIR
jgi:small-conductance mechanosensitive channel